MISIVYSWAGGNWFCGRYFNKERLNAISSSEQVKQCCKKFFSCLRLSGLIIIIAVSLFYTRERETVSVKERERKSVCERDVC